MVQLPQPLEEPIHLSAQRAARDRGRADRGGPVLRTIADISKERIRRAIARIREEESFASGERTDLGFRVFQTSTVEIEAPGKPDDLVWNLALALGYPLDSSMTRTKAGAARDVFRVTHGEREGALVICLDEPIRRRDAEALLLEDATTIVCRGRALDEDTRAYLAKSCSLRVI
jgi:hypothetical protein